MRKTTIALMIFAVLALFIAGCAQKATETQIVEQTQPVELIGDEPVLPESPGAPATPPVVHVLEISLEDYTQTISQCFLKGEATLDGEAFETDFDVYCDGSKIDDFSTNKKGEFDFSVAKAECPEGADAWVVADGVKSPSVKVHYEVDSGAGAPSDPLGFSFPERTSAPAGVPEFSIMTLGLAVVIGGLGLAYLRKN
jgi:hypothetical protein